MDVLLEIDIAKTFRGSEKPPPSSLNKLRIKKKQTNRLNVETLKLIIIYNFHSDPSGRSKMLLPVLQMHDTES